jgi:hypothetical protein
MNAVSAGRWIKQMKSDESPKPYPVVNKSFIVIACLWTILVALMLTWTIRKEGEETTIVALNQARSFFKLILATRFWNSMHGGVYIPATSEAQPNPAVDIPHHEVVTTGGEVLTLVTPESMTRQISEIALERSQVRFHLTSLRPIRPGNAPQEWEVKALEGIRKRTDEYYGWASDGKDAPGIFRYMGALWTEAPCLKCHSKQGYKEGDLRGGIGVTIPATDIRSAHDSRVHVTVLGFLVIWLAGSLGVYLSFRTIKSDYLERSNLIERLQTALTEVRTLEGFIPICAWCKKVRNDEGYWEQIEKYLKDRSEAEFTHSICPDCAAAVSPRPKTVSPPPKKG